MINSRVLNEKIKAQKEITNQRFADSEKAVAAALAAQEKATAAAFAAAKEAVIKAEISQQRVNESQNEFRGQLKDQNAATERNMMPRAETELLVREIRSSIQDLQKSRDTITGKSMGIANLTSSVYAFIFAIAAIAAIAGHFL